MTGVIVTGAAQGPGSEVSPTGRAGGGAAGMRRLAADVLDDLPLTERAYHHLSHTAPLVAEILARLPAPDASGGVLMIGGNALLGHTLLRLGYALDVWAFGDAYLTDELASHVRRSITPDELAAPELELPHGAYAAIILPLVLESLPQRASALLAHLGRALRPDGSLIVAAANLGRLEVRAAALAGRNFAPSGGAPPTLSLSWPSLPGARPFHRDDLLRLCREAGLQLRECRFVTGYTPFMEMDSFSLPVFALRQSAYMLKQALAPTRDVMLVHLTRRVADEGEHVDAQERSGGDGRPHVSVIVSAGEEAGTLRETLSSLLDQTYPRDAFDVAVLHDVAAPQMAEVVGEFAARGVCPVREVVVPRGEGPRARNRAMAEAGGTICAHTDGATRVPPDWLEGAVRWFDERTAAVSGPIFTAQGSIPRYLDVPGSRPDPDDRGVSPKGFFSIANVFYRRAVFLATGGFDERFEADGAAPRLGWDTELAWRLRRMGWESRFREEVYASRRYAAPAGRSWMREQWAQAQDLPRLVATVPELGDQLLTARYFASSHTLYFDVLLASVLAATARRRWTWMLLGLPWLATVAQRLDLWPPGEWGGSLRLLVRRGARHVVWAGGFLSGSLRAKRLVL